MSRNPFSHRSPINKPNRFIGREQELRDILACLHDETFDSVSIVGERRIGKTSLLKFLAQQSLDFRVHFIYIDLQTIDSNETPLDFWDEVLSQLARLISDPELKATALGFGQTGTIKIRLLNRFFKKLDHAGLSIVLLLDELEHLANNPNFGPNFFYGLRA